MCKFSWTRLPLISKKNEKRIIHIHWETNIYGSAYAVVSIVRIVARFSTLWLLKCLGVRFIWTMHNLEAHDYPHVKIDKVGKYLMWKLADTIIIQEKKIAEQEYIFRQRKKIVWIPQGNYIGIYGPLWDGDREVLRSEYKIHKGEIVLLALGSIRPYKNLPTLIQIIKDIDDKVSNIKLLIMGKVTSDYEKIIRDQISGSHSIQILPGFVPDKDISRMFALADYSIFYYGESSLSSAAMIMSLSYGVPVITRNIPASEMIQDGINGFIFRTQDEMKTLLINLGQAPKLNRDVIMSSIDSQSWDLVAAKVIEAYINLWFL